jgi:adenine phosphoribosyltransferase
MPLEAEILARLRDVPDFPQPGVLFKDITPLLRDAGAFSACVQALVEGLRPHRPDVVLGVEARGFLIAAPVALALGAALVPVRKPGKLPGPSVGTSYQLEYGQGELEVHRDAIRPGQRVAVVDDLLATGGTSRAAGELAQQLGGELAAYAFLIELAFLNGRAALPRVPVISLATVT